MVRARVNATAAARVGRVLTPCFLSRGDGQARVGVIVKRRVGLALEALATLEWPWLLGPWQGRRWRFERVC